jgi:hypothetical protein
MGRNRSGSAEGRDTMKRQMSLVDRWLMDKVGFRIVGEPDEPEIEAGEWIYYQLNDSYRDGTIVRKYGDSEYAYDSKLGWMEVHFMNEYLNPSSELYRRYVIMSAKDAKNAIDVQTAMSNDVG